MKLKEIKLFVFVTFRFKNFDQIDEDFESKRNEKSSFISHILRYLLVYRSNNNFLKSALKNQMGTFYD